MKMSKNTTVLTNKKKPPLNFAKWWLKYWQLVAMVFIPFCFIALFSYGPMYGLQIAFRNFRAIDGLWKSPWVGLEHFIRFFSSYQFSRVIRNTLVINFYSLLVGFPIPIVFALLLNCVNHIRFKKTVQIVTYAPHFISTVVIVSMLIQILSPKFGLINNFIKLFGGEEILFMATGSYFYSLFVWSGIWQSMGWSAIIYISALSSIDPTLHEAAIVDGASRFRRILHVDIPGILPTIIILLILSAGSIMNVGFEKVFLMQNQTNTEYSEVISTLIYKTGIQASIPNYSYSTAIGLFNNIVNFILLVAVNTFSRRVGETSLW